MVAFWTAERGGARLIVPPRRAISRLPSLQWVELETVWAQFIVARVSDDDISATNLTSFSVLALPL